MELPIITQLKLYIIFIIITAIFTTTGINRTIVTITIIITIITTRAINVNTLIMLIDDIFLGISTINF